MIRRTNVKTRVCKGRGVFVVADRPLAREGLVLVLEKAGFEIVGQAGDEKGVFAHPSLILATVVVVDLFSDDGNTVGLVKKLRSREHRPVVCSAHGDSARIRAAFAAGALGYVTQGDEPQDLVEAIRVVASGRNYVSPRAGAGLARKISGLENPQPVEELSAQQWQIYELLGKGESTDEIARRVHVSPRTVESYCYRMIEKLDLSGMKDLRRHAITNVNSDSA